MARSLYQCFATTRFRLRFRWTWFQNILIRQFPIYWRETFFDQELIGAFKVAAAKKCIGANSTQG